VDIFELLDELEQEIEEAKKVPLSNKIIAEKERILDYIDRIRGELPDEMRQAKWVSKERERIIDEAKVEADEMKKEARHKVMEMAQESEIVKEAKLQSEKIITDAYGIAHEVRSGANKYADEVLASIENRLQKTLTIVESGRSELKERTSKKEAIETEEIE